MPALPKEHWTFMCPVCDFNHVKVYGAREGRTAYVVCGRCRTLVTFDPAPRMNQAIDLYNLYCDFVRPRMGSYVNIQPTQQSEAAPRRPAEVTAKSGKESGVKVIFAAPLCVEHDFILGEPIRGHKAEMIAQTRICLKCGHAERDQV